MIRATALLVLLIALPIAPATARAQPASGQSDEIAALKAEISHLEQRLAALEARSERTQASAPQSQVVSGRGEQPLNAPVVTAGSSGFALTSADGDNQLRLRGLIQATSREFTGGKVTPVTGGTFFLNRVRPILEGTVARYYDFELAPDFGLGRSLIQEAFANVIPQAQFEAGKFKVPYGIERLQRDRDLEFIERGITNNLVPNRDIGAMLHGDLFEGALAYQLAVMNGVPNDTSSTDADSNDSKDFVGRAFALPFRASNHKLLSGLGVGFAATYGDESDGTISTYRTAGRQIFFSYNPGVSAAGQRLRLSPQGYYYFGPFGLMAEFDSDTHRLNLQQAGAKPINRSQRFTDRAWNVQGSYLLTGEKATYDGVVPLHDFAPHEQTWGAWEIVARLGSLGVDSDVFRDGFADLAKSARTATEWGGGINWYLNRNVKFQLDYLRTYFDGGASGGHNRPDESVILSQLQLAF
jgi:phosphate-selective porin OprO/OprP